MNVFSYAAHCFHESPTRILEYEHARRVTLHGNVLDLGGGSLASYAKLMRGTYKLTSLNIDPSISPTHVCDITKPFPLETGTFDIAISFNTFEHVKELDTPLAETFRTLKPGGRVIFSTPYLKEIHASPDNYWRISASAWKHLLLKHGFTDVHVTPLGFGLFTARFGLIYGPLPRILRPICGFFSALLDKLFSKLSRYRRMCGPHIYPLAYIAQARKP